MRIAVWGSRNALQSPLSSITNTHDLRSWFITKELYNRQVEVDFYKFAWEIPILERKVDHFICTTNAGGLTRCVNEHGIDIMNGLRPFVKGKICEMSDRSPLQSVGDLFFTMTPENFENKTARYIGWAADEELCSIRKESPPLILVDHSLYVQGPDFSDVVAKGLSRVRLDFHAYQITNSGVRLMPLEGYQPEMFNRKKQAPYDEICDWYSRASIFIVTHAESLGISVIEAAMAGARILLYPTAIHEPLISPLQHSFYDSGNPISVSNMVTYILRNLNPTEAREKALSCSWKKCVERMLKHLEE